MRAATCVLKPRVLAAWAPDGRNLSASRRAIASGNGICAGADGSDQRVLMGNFIYTAADTANDPFAREPSKNHPYCEGITRIGEVAGA